MSWFQICIGCQEHCIIIGVLIYHSIKSENWVKLWAFQFYKFVRSIQSNKSCFNSISIVYKFLINLRLSYKNPKEESKERDDIFWCPRLSYSMILLHKEIANWNKFLEHIKSFPFIHDAEISKINSSSQVFGIIPQSIYYFRRCLDKQFISKDEKI